MKINFPGEVKLLFKGRSMISEYTNNSAYYTTGEGEKGAVAGPAVFKASQFLHFMIIVVLLLCGVSSSVAGEITGPEVKIRENEIHATVSLLLDDKYMQEIRNGIRKEFKFYIDIFRVWNVWPDEFVSSKSFTRIIRSDPVKTEFIATSSDGNTQIKKRFKSLESMLKWALSFDDLKLANVRDLDPGVYFVRVTVESKIRQLPPVIGYFMIFLPENEFKIRKDSSYFSIGER
jgi:hypothetical protein